MRRLVAVLLTALCGIPLAVLTSTAAHAACGTTVQISSLTFDPAQIAPGQSSTSTTVVQNCTGQDQTVSYFSSARFIGSLTGCAIIDPLPPQQITVPANGTWTGRGGYTIFSGCQATALEVSARVSDLAGTVLDTRTADLPFVASPPPPGCTATYHVTSAWAGGFVVEVDVADATASPLSGWTVSWTFTGNETVASGWNAAISQSGTAVTAKALSYNRVVAPGASTSFGFLGRGSGQAPTGLRCEIG